MKPFGYGGFPPGLHGWTWSFDWSFVFLVFVVFSGVFVVGFFGFYRLLYYLCMLCVPANVLY